LQIGFALAAVVVGFAVLFLIRDFMGAFVLGALLAFLINPAVDRMVSARVPRSAAILAAFIGVVVVLVGLATLIVPLLTTEFAELRQQAPSIASRAQQQLSALEGQPLSLFGYRVDLTGLTKSIEQHANEFLLGQFGNALSFGLAALTTLLQLLLMLVVAFLMALDAHRISTFMRRLVPTDYRTDFDDIWSKVKTMLLAYFRGQLVIAALIGILVGIACWALGLRFALALGLIAGITSLVPYLGPILGAVPAVLVGLASGPTQALEIAVAYLVITNVILNLVFPKVMGDAVRLPALLVIVAFIAGASLGGILGMFVAVPIAAGLRILFDHLHPRLYGTAG
jgi:predicted PurR-regulated permease PerM